MTEPFSAPFEIPGFVLEGFLGAGAMGRVYRARQLSTGRSVAIKVLHATAPPRDVARLEREIQSLALLRHPNVVALYEAGQHGGRRYLVLEFVDGMTLAEVIKARALGPKPLAAVLAKVAMGLAAAHGIGLIHRDVKPENILLDAAGEPRLADFGLGRPLDADTITRTGVALGTPLYIAPEVLQGGARGALPAGDIYALGLTLWEGLLGEHPNPGMTWLQIHKVIVEGNLKPLPSSVPPHLRELCEEATSIEPADRPDAATFAVRLLKADTPAATRSSPLPLLIALAIGLGVGGLAMAITMPKAPADTGEVAPVPTHAALGSLEAQLVTLADELEAIERELWKAAATPTPDEAARGELPIRNVDEALDSLLARSHIRANTPSHDQTIIDRIADRRWRRLGRPTPQHVKLLAESARAQTERIGAERLRKAGEWCEALGREGRKSPRGAGVLGKYLRAECDPRRAKRAGLALCVIGTADAYEQLVLAILRFRDTAFQRALEEPQRKLERSLLAGEPASSAAMRRCRSVLLINLGHTEEAIRVYDTLLGDDPNDVDILNDRGFARNLLGRVDDARADFSAATEADPESFRAWYSRALLRHRAGDTEGGSADLDRALEIKPRDGNALRARARMRELGGDIVGALADLSAALVVDPNLAIAWAQRGVLLFAQNHSQGAVDDLTRSIELDCLSSQSYSYRGLARARVASSLPPEARAEKLAAARADLDTALGLDSSAWLNWHHRAQILCMTREWKAALKDCEQAAGLAPGQREPWFLLGQLSWIGGNVDKARAAFVRSLQIHQAAGLPEDLFSLLYLAALGGLENVEALTNVDLETNGIHGHVAHWYAGNVDDAALLAEIERHSGVERERARAVVHLHLGARAERVGKLAEARAAYQTAADTGVDTIEGHVAGQALVRLPR